MNKQSNLSRLMGYAGRHKILTCRLYNRPDVFAHERVSGCRQHPQRTYASYYSPAAWGNGKVWKRKTAENRKQFQCRCGNAKIMFMSGDAMIF